MGSSVSSTFKTEVPGLRSGMFNAWCPSYTHLAWKELLGYIIHPDIAAQLPANPFIADIVAGTGIWLTDLSQTLPNATLDGFDDGPSNFYHEHWRPQNVFHYRWSLLVEPPREMYGRYDLVHIRLNAVRMDEIHPFDVVLQLNKLLKPGGWIQWEEEDIKGATLTTPNDSVQAPASQQLVGRLRMEARRGWTGDVGSVFNSSGMLNAATFTCPNPAMGTNRVKHVSLMLSCLLRFCATEIGLIEAADHQQDLFKYEWWKKSARVARRANRQWLKDWRALITGIWEESKLGVKVDCDRLVHIAQKVTPTCRL